jgi:cellulose synthase operon protein C
MRVGSPPSPETRSAGPNGCNLVVALDLSTRGFANLAGAKNSAWLHAVFEAANRAKTLAFDQLVRWTVDLIIAGQNYVGIRGETIARAAALDFQQSTSPGPLTTALTGVLGGKNAEPRSHAEAAADCLIRLWRDEDARPFRQLVTIQVLRGVTRERVGDSDAILDHIEALCIRIPALMDYISKWRVGHFFLNPSH